MTVSCVSRSSCKLLRPQRYQVLTQELSYQIWMFQHSMGHTHVVYLLEAIQSYCTREITPLRCSKVGLLATSSQGCGTARHAIEGLYRSGEHYSEAVDCLTARYDRPRLIHQAHVRKTLEAPCLRDGSGRELRRFHDTMQQHSWR